MSKSLKATLLALSMALCADTLAQLPQRIPSFPSLGLALYEKPMETPSVSVAQVEERSPASVAGLMRGDFVRRIGERPVAKIVDVIAALNQVEPGVSVEIVVLRGDQRQTLRITPLLPDQLAADR
jgi:S1-C subfamily serine protease